jgi:Cysteine rich repeat
MHKAFLALTLLSVPVSTSALARGGTEQEEKACKRDVQRFCRKLMDQGDFTILACLKENRPKLTASVVKCWSATANSSNQTAVRSMKPKFRGNSISNRS